MGIATLPFGQFEAEAAADRDGIGADDALRRAMGHYERFEKGIACQAVGPVEASAGNFADSVEPTQAGGPVEIGRDAPTLVMGCGHDRNRLLSNVDAQIQ